MTSALDSASDSRRSARRGARRDAVTFSMGKGTFRLLVLLGLVVVGVAFGVGFFAGQTVDVGDRARVIAVAPIRSAAERSVAKRSVAEKPKEVRPPPKPVAPPPAKAKPAPEPEPEVPVPAIAVVRKSPRRGYGLQLGAFESETDARRFIETNADILGGRTVYLLTSEVPGRGVWHRVRWGKFRTKRLAKRGKKRMDESVRDTAIVVSYR